MNNSTLSPATSGFVLAAAITALFNTGLAWAKDLYPPLNNMMKAVAGHHWTTHGLFDLVLFIGLGVAFTQAKTAQKIAPQRLNTGFVVAIAIAAVGLGLWYVFF